MIKLKELNTPCYIFLPDELQAGIDQLYAALEEYWPNYRTGYSFKTNSLPYLVDYMKNAGFYAEVVSGDEYRLAVYRGYEHIIYNGPVKERETFFDALRKGHIINIDAKRELRWLSEYMDSGEETASPIGLRVNFDIEGSCEGQTSAGDAGSRFGFSYESGELAAAIDALRGLDIQLSGLHLHISSKTRSLDIYRELSRMAVRLKSEYDLALDYVDLGGGYFGGMKGRPEFPDYLRVISGELSKGFDPDETALIMEPGTSLASRCFDYITRVVDVRETYAKRIVTVDGSRTDVDPLHTKSGYIYEVISGNDQSFCDRPVIPGQTIAGYTCMENDRLMHINDSAELQEGDMIRIQKAGGYTMCLTPLFIRYFPAVYEAAEDGYRIIREHWGPQEYCGGSKI